MMRRSTSRVGVIVAIAVAIMVALADRIHNHIKQSNT